MPITQGILPPDTILFLIRILDRDDRRIPHKMPPSEP